MENVNALSKHSTTFHCGQWAGECHDPDGISSDLQDCAGCLTGYHTYSVVVDRRDAAAEELRFSLDGVQTFAVRQNQVSDATWKATVDLPVAVFDDRAGTDRVVTQVLGWDQQGVDERSAISEPQDPGCGRHCSVKWAAVETQWAALRISSQGVAERCTRPNGVQ
jgi:hypothetical protein